MGEKLGGGWTMQPIFRRSKSYLRDRNQSVRGRAAPRNEMKVSRFRRTAFGRWSAKRPRVEGLVVDSGLFKRNDEQAWIYAKCNFSFGLATIDSRRSLSLPPSFQNEIYRPRLSSRYTDYPVDRGKKVTTEDED